MRWFIGFVLALALLGSPPSVSAQPGEEPATYAALGVHPATNAALQLMLRSGYFHDLSFVPRGKLPYASQPARLVGFGLKLASVTSPLTLGVQPVEEDSLSSWQLEGPATVTEEEQPAKRLSKRARIAIGVTVPIVVIGVGVGAGIGAALSKGWSSTSSQ